MLGRHQAFNGALAVSAALLLRERWPQIGEDAIRRGLLARLPGRMEIVQDRPTVVLDGAHNPEKMRSLATALREVFPGCKPVLVIGVLAAKQAEASLAGLIPLAHSVIVTTPLVKEKPALAPDVLAATCRSLGGQVLVEPELPAALERAIGMAGADGLVCVTGSLYMVGQARERWTPAARVVAARTSFPVKRS
jgi:dihydrofolate synthase/folylpolyglutamate synthase